MLSRVKKIAVFCSGQGSNLQALIDAGADHGAGYSVLGVDIGLVVSDKSGCGALDRARSASLPVFVSTLTKSSDFSLGRDIFERESGDAVEAAGCDLIVLAGFMKILSESFLRRFNGKIINLHPSLLPAFPGAHAIRDAFDHGVKVTGCTVHFVDTTLDGGPIIAQKPVAVEETDTLESLAERVHLAEHELLPWVVWLFSEGRIAREGPRVRVR